MYHTIFIINYYYFYLLTADLYFMNIYSINKLKKSSSCIYCHVILCYESIIISIVYNRDNTTFIT